MKYIFLLLATALLSGICSKANDTIRTEKKSPAVLPELRLPGGFTAVNVFTSGSTNRHMVFHPKGLLYVKLSRLKEGKGIYVLRDKDNKGNFEVVSSFGEFTGTGIDIADGYLYASSDSEVFRYKLNEQGEVMNPEAPEKIITGLLNRRQHASKSIAVDNAGNIYVNIGAPSNACQVQDRTAGSPGQSPCPILDSAGGIWQFRTDKLNQSYGEGVKFATGLRNVVGLDWDPVSKQLFAMQHGRDGLNTLYPDMFSAEQSAEIPAEEMFLVKKGSNFGWPYCYFDPLQKLKVLAPEYGGDGKKQERCEGVEKPVMAFPGHWAPNALLFYTGNQFPEKYKSGAFIAFHGSWNRAPLKQKGYNVVFVPFRNGVPTGEYEVFADGFMGTEEINSPGQAQHRPCGLAQGPDGSLYISDSVKGAIWKITYNK